MTGVTVRLSIAPCVFGRMAGLTLRRGERNIFVWSGLMRPGESLKDLLRRAYEDFGAGRVPGQTMH